MLPFIGEIVLKMLQVSFSKKSKVKLLQVSLQFNLFNVLMFSCSISIKNRPCFTLVQTLLTTCERVIFNYNGQF